MSSSSVIVSGGVIRIAFPSNNNQNKSSPFLRDFSITFEAISSDLTITASINPFPLISVINGWTNRLLIITSLCSVFSIKLEFNSSVNVAFAAAATTGCPPKVVICPSFGCCFRQLMID